MAPVAGDPAAPTLADIMEAIRAWKDTLMVKINHMATEIGLIHHNMDKFRSRVSEAEERSSHLEESTRTDSRELHALQMQVKALQDKANDTENRLRRNNIRVLGLPEKAEGPRPAEFAETFLTQLLDLPAMPPMFVVE